MRSVQKDGCSHPITDAGVAKRSTATDSRSVLEGVHGFESPPPHFPHFYGDYYDLLAGAGIKSPVAAQGQEKTICPVTRDQCKM